MSQSESLEPLCYWPGLRGRWLPWVLLQHRTGPSNSHYDLMLDVRPGEKLWDLETASLPLLTAKPIRWTTHGFHRRRYLWYEGDLGNKRGRVKRVWTGRYRVTREGQCLVVSIERPGVESKYTLWRFRRGTHLWIRIE